MKNLLILFLFCVSYVVLIGLPLALAGRAPRLCPLLPLGEKEEEEEEPKKICRQRRDGDGDASSPQIR